MTIVIVAAIFSLGILVIFLGLASSGRGSGMSARLERYAAGKTESTTSTTTSSPGLGEVFAQSVALARLNRVVEQRDFGANLARDIARADLKLKPSEYLAIWAGSIVGVPLLFLALSIVFAPLGTGIGLLIGMAIGFFLPRMWLGRRRAGR
jgi:hypothetical protein